MGGSPDNKEKMACAGAGGSLGLAAIAGACSAGCGVAAAPLAGLLTSIGLGSIASFLPTLRIPLIAIALALGLNSLWVFIKKKNIRGAVACGGLLGIGATALGWQMLCANDCKTASMIEAALRKLSPQTKEVFQKGVYPLWPELGRAPTISEVQAKLGYTSEATVLAAFRDLQALGFRDMLYEGTTNIRWLWPFSSIDHGVEVTLSGAKPVHARCAIDALGMSAMFGKAAQVSITSPLDRRSIEMEINGHQIVKADTGVVVSHSDSCDEMLFFSSHDEYERYVKTTGKNHLKLYTLEEALERGIRSFGGVLKS